MADLGGMRGSKGTRMCWMWDTIPGGSKGMDAEMEKKGELDSQLRGMLQTITPNTLLYSLPSIFNTQLCISPVERKQENERTSS